MNAVLVTANLFALLSAVISGSSLVVLRLAMEEIDPVTLAALRFLLAGGLLLLCLLALARPTVWLARRDIGLVFLIGASYYAAFPALLNLSLQFTATARVALILATTPIWAAVFARWLGGERLTPRQLAGALLACCGLVLAFAEGALAWQGGGGALVGNGLALVGVALGASSFALIKRVLVHNSPFAATGWAMLMGSACLLPLAAASAAAAVPQLSQRGLWLLFYLVVPGGVLNMCLLSWAQRRLLPTQAAVYINLVPLVAAALGAAILGESLTPLLLFSLAVVLAGVLLANWPARQQAVPSEATPLR